MGYAFKGRGVMDIEMLCFDDLPMGIGVITDFVDA
jgi:hypothetical protein